MVPKKLSEMSLEELWLLFPVILREHNPEYTNWFNTEKLLLEQLLCEDIVRLSHIGSSAVAGLISKPTVDILLEVNSPL